MTAPARESFGLYLVLTRPKAGYERCAEAAVEHKVRYVQLRMKGERRDEVLRVARRLRRVVASPATRLIVNDDLEAAMASDADGVHLGQEDMPVAEARRLWPAPGKLFGLSTHGEAQALSATAIRPDYIGVGPLFPTPTKERPDPVLGVPRAAAIAQSSPLTYVAIGGINDETLPGVLEAGIENFAVVRHVCQSDRPGERIRELVEIWSAASANRASGSPGSTRLRSGQA
jgi:thiamine-phosphate pyrophosphorylase